LGDLSYGDYSVVKEKAFFYCIFVNKPAALTLLPSHCPKGDTRHCFWSLLDGTPEPQRSH